MTENEFTPRPDLEEAPAGRSGWGKWIALGAVAAVAVAGVGVAGAIGSDYGPGRHHFRSMAIGYGEHRFGRVLDEIDATKEQEDRIWAIIDQARSDTRPLMREFRDARGGVVDLLGAATIDRAAAERIRSERLAAMDEASKRLTAALLDAAEVLTPEQRAKLATHFKERGERGRW